MSLGDELRRLRKKRGFTLANVGQKTELSISFLSDVERGRTRPSLDTLEKLAACYHVSVKDILPDTEFDFPSDEREYPAGFQEFLQVLRERGENVDDEMKDLLMRTEHRSKRSVQTKEDWLMIYHTLKGLLGE